MLRLIIFQDLSETMKRLGSTPLILLIVLFKLEGRAADYRSLPARNDLHDGKTISKNILYFLHLFH